MRWKKVGVILGIIISLSTIGATIGEPIYRFAVKVDAAFAFIEKTDRRHTQEDLVFLWKQRKAMVDKRDSGDWMPADVDALLRLQSLIKELEKELGY